MDQGNLVGALAVSDQRHSRNDRGLGGTVAAAASENGSERTDKTGRANADPAGGGACQPPDRAEGSASPWLVVADMHRSVVGKRLRYRPFGPPQLAIGASGRATPDLEAALVRGRLRVELLPWRRPVRFGLSDAGVSRLRARPRCL